MRILISGDGVATPAYRAIAQISPVSQHLFLLPAPVSTYNIYVAMSSAGGLDVLFQTVANTSLHNPVEPYIASAWNYMTDNYSRFTISMWISVVLHEVRFEARYSSRGTVTFSSIPRLSTSVCVLLASLPNSYPSCRNSKCNRYRSSI